VASRLQPIEDRGDPYQKNSITQTEPKLAEFASGFAGCPVKVMGSDELRLKGAVELEAVTDGTLPDDAGKGNVIAELTCQDATGNASRNVSLGADHARPHGSKRDRILVLNQETNPSTVGGTLK